MDLQSSHRYFLSFCSLLWHNIQYLKHIKDQPGIPAAPMLLAPWQQLQILLFLLDIGLQRAAEYRLSYAGPKPGLYILDIDYQATIYKVVQNAIRFLDNSVGV